MSLWFRDPFFGYNIYDGPFNLFTSARNRDDYMNQIDKVINNSLKKLFEENEDASDNEDIVEEYTLDSKGNKKPIAGKEKSEKKKESTQKVENKKEQSSENKDEESSIFSRMSVFSNHSRGGVEEVHETISDSNGVSTETHTKKIGDRWVRIEKKTDKDGTVTKETWHNIDANDHEKFHEEWNKRLGLTNKKAIENKKD